MLLTRSLSSLRMLGKYKDPKQRMRELWALLPGGSCVERVGSVSATKDERGGPLIRPISDNYALTRRVVMSREALVARRVNASLLGK